MRYIFFTFSFIFFSVKKVFFSKKIFHYKTFFHIKTFFSANYVYFVKTTYLNNFVSNIIAYYQVSETWKQNFLKGPYQFFVTEAVVLRCPLKKVFLEISQNPKENTCARVFFFNCRPQACNFIKKETLERLSASSSV